MNSNSTSDISLPTRGKLKLVTFFSILIAVLMAVAAIAGLFFSADTYQSDDLLQSFMPTDVSILFIGVPMLLGSIWLTLKGKLIGLLLWPGALFYVIYSYLICIFALPLLPIFIVHLTLVMLSIYTLSTLLTQIDQDQVRERLKGAVPERLTGGILAGLGSPFVLRAMWVMINALISHTPLSRIEFALNTTDFLISPAWVICGIYIWRKKAFGYVTGLGMLFQGIMLFVGLLILLVIQPSLTNEPFPVVDVAVVGVMVLISLIPFVRYARGVSD